MQLNNKKQLGRNGVSTKFNVDYSSKFKLGPTGIGGVLKDSMVAVKIVFSKAIGVANSKFVELLVVREIVCILTFSRWVHSHRLIIESDFSNVVKWIKKREVMHSASWHYICKDKNHIILICTVALVLESRGHYRHFMHWHGSLWDFLWEKVSNSTLLG